MYEREMTAHVDTHCRKKASFKREEKKMCKGGGCCVLLSALPRYTLIDQW